MQIAALSCIIRSKRYCYGLPFAERELTETN